MTDFATNTILRYFTAENGKHYTAIVLKDDKILSVKKAGEKDKTKYDSLLHWITTLPGSVTISDLQISSRDAHLTQNDTITLKGIAPNYDLLRFLLTYEVHSLINSLVSTENTSLRKTYTYVRDNNGDLQPVKYNRVKKLLYSEHHNLFGSSLAEIGLPSDTDIYVSVSSCVSNKKCQDITMKKMTFPFNIQNYTEFYNSKIAFIESSYLSYLHTWPDSNYKPTYQLNMVYNYLKNKGYYIISDYFNFYGSDSIFHNKNFKYLSANIVIVQPLISEMIVYNYNPFSITRIPFKLSDEEILEELKYSIEGN